MAMLRGNGGRCFICGGLAMSGEIVVVVQQEKESMVHRRILGKVVGKVVVEKARKGC